MRACIAQLPNGILPGLPHPAMMGSLTSPEVSEFEASCGRLVVSEAEILRRTIAGRDGNA